MLEINLNIKIIDKENRTMLSDWELSKDFTKTYNLSDVTHMVHCALYQYCKDSVEDNNGIMIGEELETFNNSFYDEFNIKNIVK